jgi:hypothetical protein
MISSLVIGIAFGAIAASAVWWVILVRSVTSLHPDELR